jgi:hypothetical protein
VSLWAVFDQYEINRYDFGQDINFKLYGADKKTAFNANGFTAVVKTFKKHGDRAFFFRDVAKALTVIGQAAQVVNDVSVDWDTQASGEGHFAYTSTARPNTPGYVWLVVQLTKAGQTISSRPFRIFIHFSEAV